MKKFFLSIAAWFLAHPVIEHFLEGGIYAILLAVVAYVKTTPVAGGTQVLSLGAFGVVILAALKMYIANNKTTLLAFVQDQLQALAAITPAVAAVPVPTSTTLSPITKALLVAFLLMGFTGSASAGYLISSAKENASRETLSLPTGTALYLMPIEGFQVGANLPNPTYGLSLNEDIVWGALNTVNGATNLSPIFGIGASLYVDGAGVINGNGPLVALVGLNAVGPDLDLLGIGNGTGLVPDVMATENFASGEFKITGGLTIFTNLGPGTAVKITN